MNKAFDFFLWENYTSVNTPLNEQHLNKINRAVEEIDNRVIVHDMTKFNTVDAQGLIKSIEFNHENGVFTITYVNGTTAAIDTMLEKLAVNFDFDENAQQLVITLDNGEVKRVDLSAFITPIEFVDSDTIAFQLLENGKVTAIIKEGSIGEKHLRPDYLADIKVEAGRASAATEAAEKSATAAAASEAAAATSAESAERNNNAAQSAREAAETAATTATGAAASAAGSATAAAQSAQDAATSAASVRQSEINAAASAAAAEESEIAARKSEESASDSALLSQSWAIGNTGIREGENTNCSKFYCNQSQGFRDEAAESASAAQDAVEQINKKLEMAEFDIDDDGNLIYTDGSSYEFTVDDNGDLNWEVAS